MSDIGKTKAEPVPSEFDAAPPVDEASIDRGWMDRDLSHVSTSGLLPEGSRFGVYTVGPCIGHGGMARIYRAEHEGLRRSVALKVLLEDFAQDEEGHERFLREGRIAAAIKHPNVVNIFDVGFQGAIPYLVMEFLEGEDLEAMMYANGSIPEATVIDLLVPIVAGLSAVHDAGVIHRDLKPGNIFLSRGRNDEIEPKLLDFGISKQTGREQFKLTTARGLLIGTPLYMSPEAIQGGEVTARSDQYSLGVVLYECCTGFNPFAADTLAETVRRITSGDFPPPGQRNPSLSKRMGRIIERAMSLDPNQRFADMRELGRELLFLAGQRTRVTWSLTFGEIVSRRTGELAQISASMRTRPPHRKANLASIAAVSFGLIMFASAVAIVWSRQSPEVVVERDLSSEAAALQGTGAPPTVAAPVEAAPPRPVDGTRRMVEPRPLSEDLPTDVTGDTRPETSEKRASGSSNRQAGGRTSDKVVSERSKEAPAPRVVRRPRRTQPQETAVRRRPVASNDEGPDWVPVDSVREPAPKRPSASTSLGTNNAPILD